MWKDIIDIINEKMITCCSNTYIMIMKNFANSLNEAELL